jgi:hypothetical protein
MKAAACEAATAVKAASSSVETSAPGMTAVLGRSELRRAYEHKREC